MPGELEVVPFLDDTTRGIFATRSPRHPNPIGLTAVRLLAVTDQPSRYRASTYSTAHVLDIKPYVPTFDSIAAERTGWLKEAAQQVYDVRADARFDQT